MDWKQHQEMFAGKRGIYSFTGPASLLLAMLDYGKAIEEWGQAADHILDQHEAGHDDV